MGNVDGLTAFASFWLSSDLRFVFIICCHGWYCGLFHARLHNWRRSEFLVRMLILDMSFHVSRVDERSSAVGAIEGLVKVIAECSLAQLLLADSANEVPWIALKILALVHRSIQFRCELCFAILQ